MTNPKRKNSMIRLFSLHEIAEDLKLPPAVVALWAADGMIPHIMRDGMPLFDPVAVGKHIAEQLNNLNKYDDGNDKTTTTSAD
jgi:hypothetical protein